MKKLLKPRNLHIFAVVVWICLLWPSMTVWKDSIQWVIAISVYANIVGHLSGASAAHASERAKKDQK